MPQRFPMVDSIDYNLIPQNTHYLIYDNSRQLITNDKTFNARDEIQYRYLLSHQIEFAI